MIPVVNDSLARGPAARSPGYRLSPTLALGLSVAAITLGMLLPPTHLPSHAALVCVLLAALSLARVPFGMVARRLAIFLGFALLFAVSVPLSQGFRGGWEIAQGILFRGVESFLSGLWLVSVVPFDRPARQTVREVKRAPYVLLADRTESRSPAIARQETIPCRERRSPAHDLPAAPKSLRQGDADAEQQGQHQKCPTGGRPAERESGPDPARQTTRNSEPCAGQWVGGINMPTVIAASDSRSFARLRKTVAKRAGRRTGEPRNHSRPNHSRPASTAPGRRLTARPNPIASRKTESVPTTPASETDRLCQFPEEHVL